jgi:diguanylate cyclase (GGDEF)-like protein
MAAAIQPTLQLPQSDRTACEQALERYCEATAKGEAVVVSLAIFDVDLMGKHNAVLGRDNADSALCALAAYLSEGATGEATLYRFGGDAFALMLPGVEKEQAFLKVEQLRQQVAEAAGEDGFTVSAGIASVPDDAAGAKDLVLKASEALYRAKVSGRNKVCLAREEKMVTKTSHYQQGQLLGLRRLAEREGIGEAVLLREALNDLLRKYNA